MSFPDGYVGGEVWLRGVRWAILRPISRGTVSFAGERMSLDELLPAREDRRRFEEWRAALGNQLTQEILGFIPEEAANPSIRWLRVLQWCSRDERAKYSHIWNWRESDQNNEPSAYQRPSVDGDRLVRGTLGLNDDEGAILDQAIDSLARRIDKLKEDYDHVMLDPKFWITEHEEWLAEQLRENGLGHAASGEMNFAALEQKWEEDVNSGKKQVAALRGQIDELAAYLKRRKIQFTKEQEKVKEPRSVEELASLFVPEARREVEKTAELLQEIEKKYYDTCMYGGIEYGRCKYIKWNQARKKAIDDAKIIDLREERRLKEQSERQAVARLRTEERNESLRALEVSWEADHKAAEKQIVALRHLLERTEERVKKLEVKRVLLERNRAAWVAAVAQIDGTIPFPKAASLKKQLEAAREEQSKLVTKRKERLEASIRTAWLWSAYTISWPRSASLRITKQVLNCFPTRLTSRSGEESKELKAKWLTGEMPLPRFP